MGKKVLLIDDDLELGRLVEMILRPMEITVYQARSGTDGLKKSYEIHPDLIILDIMMPEMDGFEVCARLRELSGVPILMLTARARECDMVRSFSLGADDFVKKPFNKSELESRVRALLRRSNDVPTQPSYIHSYIDPVLEIDLSSKTVRLTGQVVELSPKEYDLLAHLVRERGKIVSHHELACQIWGEFLMSPSSIVSLYVYYLRKKLEDGHHGHEYIRTNWGRGYWFEGRKEE
jgi:two-component system, OmpR family, KDP operon response regulator KdpE